MKKSAYDNSKLKYQLLEKKRNGVKEVIWKLNPAQKNFIEESLGFVAEPYLYRIKTRKFYSIANLPTILKDIHYKNKRGISEVVLKLDSDDKRILNEFEVRYVPCKYKIKFY